MVFTNMGTYILVCCWINILILKDSCQSSHTLLSWSILWAFFTFRHSKRFSANENAPSLESNTSAGLQSSLLKLWKRSLINILNTVGLIESTCFMPFSMTTENIAITIQLAALLVMFLYVIEYEYIMDYIFQFRFLHVMKDETNKNKQKNQTGN